MAKNELFAGRRYTFSNLLSICVSFSAFLGTMAPFWAHFGPKTGVRTYISCIYLKLSRSEGPFNAHSSIQGVSQKGNPRKAYVF